MKIASNFPKLRELDISYSYGISLIMFLMMCNNLMDLSEFARFEHKSSLDQSCVNFGASPKDTL